MSGQAQRRLKQYLVDVSLVAIAEHNAQTKGSAFSFELGELYYNRMLRFVGIALFRSTVYLLSAGVRPGLCYEFYKPC